MTVFKLLWNLHTTFANFSCANTDVLVTVGTREQYTQAIIWYLHSLYVLFVNRGLEKWKISIKYLQNYFVYSALPVKWVSKSSTLIRKSTFMSSKKARTFRVKTSCPPTPLQRPIRVPTPLVNLLSTAQRLIKTMLKWSNSSDHCNLPCSKWNNLIVFGDCRQLIWTLSFFRSKRVILNICAFLSLFTVVIRAAPTPSVLADSLSKRNAIPGPSPVCFRRTCTWSDIYYWFELEAWRSSMYK